jgi:hypothetical protein
MRKMYIDVTVKVIIEVDDDMLLNDAMDELVVDVESIDEDVEVVDSSVENYTLTDSK